MIRVYTTVTYRQTIYYTIILKTYEEISIKMYVTKRIPKRGKKK